MKSLSITVTMVWPQSQGIGQFVKTETECRGFAFLAHHLNLELGPEFEARARSARYDAVMSEVEQGDVVMTAHHRDDQVETC